MAKHKGLDMKNIIATATAIRATASTAFAGAVAYVAPEVVAIEKPARCGA